MLSHQDGQLNSSSARGEGDPRNILNKKIFVGGLSNSIHEDKLERYFSQFGEVVKVEVIKSGDGKSRGFGFVTFATQEVVPQLLGREHVIESRKLDCRPALLPGTKGEGVTFQPTKLFIGGLSSDTSPEILVNYFIQFGTIARAEIMYDHITEKSRGFGFVVFENERYLQNVFMKGNFHLINGRYCEVKQAVPRQVALSQGMLPSFAFRTSARAGRQQGRANQQYIYVPCIPVSHPDIMSPYIMYPYRTPSHVMVPSSVPRAISQPMPFSRAAATSTSSLP